MDRRRWLLVAVALAFLSGAVAFSRCSDAETQEGAPGVQQAEVARKKIVFPRDEAKQRKPRRLTPLDTERPQGEEPQGVHRDRLQSALSGAGGALFVEVNAIRHSELVTKMLKCRQDDAASQLSLLKDELGIDPSEDVDRIGFDDEVLAASGFFKDLKLPPELGEGEPYGDGARVWKLPAEEGAEGEPGFAARVGDDVLLLGESEEQVRAAVDRVEGRAPAGRPLDEMITRSEIYGSLDKQLIASFLEGAEDPVARRIAELVTGGAVRMNIDEHVKLSLDLRAQDAATGQDLAKAVGGALAMMRREAEARGDQELSWLLEQARVAPGDDGRFDVDLAVPGELILDKMGCDKDGNPR